MAMTPEQVSAAIKEIIRSQVPVPPGGLVLRTYADGTPAEWLSQCGGGWLHEIALGPPVPCSLGQHKTDAVAAALIQRRT